MPPPISIKSPIKASRALDPERAYLIGHRDGLYQARHAASELLCRLDAFIDQTEACEDPDADRIDAHVQRASSDVKPDVEELP